VKHRNFRLRFLRSTEFDAPKAAQKLVDHFDFKMGLFGQEKLAQNITLDDLDENDLIYLRSGAIQILPAVDRAGRPIFFVQCEITSMTIALDEGAEKDFIACLFGRERGELLGQLAKLPNLKEVALGDLGLMVRVLTDLVKDAKGLWELTLERVVLQGIQEKKKTLKYPSRLVLPPFQMACQQSLRYVYPWGDAWPNEMSWSENCQV
jgi:hypothetical protein